MDKDRSAAVHAGIGKLTGNIKSLISIDGRKLEYLLAAKLAGGHVILADSHGVGKTSLARALAGSIDWSNRSGENHSEAFSRIQCTVDLLPQDILGYTRLVGAGHEPVFNRGPIFAHFVLCDEINLLTPKTQGSFFQAMEEQAVSVEGQTHRLPDPFFIIATMNLKGVHLFPLPIPQLDRFMIQLSLGYPSFDDEVGIIKQHGRNDAWQRFAPVVDFHEILSWRDLVDQIDIHEEVVDYIARLVRETREHPGVQTGASPRTGVKLSRLVRALAVVRGEQFATIDLVKEIFTAAVSHRLVLKESAGRPEAVCAELLDKVPVETRRKARLVMSR